MFRDQMGFVTLRTTIANEDFAEEGVERFFESLALAWVSSSILLTLERREKPFQHSEYTLLSVTFVRRCME